MNHTEKKVLEILRKKAYLNGNQDLINDLTRSIVKALYDVNFSRY